MIVFENDRFYKNDRFYENDKRPFFIRLFFLKTTVLAKTIVLENKIFIVK